MNFILRFLSTAQTFTRHLHHAEYRRLKHLNIQRLQDTLDSIKRPTKAESQIDKVSSAAVRIQSAQRDIKTNIRELSQNPDLSSNADEDESEISDGNDEAATPDKNLAGLLKARNWAAPHSVCLAKSTHGKSQTRAAAGLRSNALEQSPYSVPSKRRSKSPALGKHAIPAQGRQSETSPRYPKAHPDAQRPNAVPQPEQSARAVTKTAVDPSVQVGTLTSKNQLYSREKFKGQLKGRRLAREGREQHTDDARDDHIPLFI